MTEEKVLKVYNEMIEAVRCLLQIIEGFSLPEARSMMNEYGFSEDDTKELNVLLRKFGAACSQRVLDKYF